MAWEARWGLKHKYNEPNITGQMGLNGLGSPLGIETSGLCCTRSQQIWLNGLGSPLGIETGKDLHLTCLTSLAKWPGKPVGD